MPANPRLRHAVCRFRQSHRLPEPLLELAEEMGDQFADYSDYVETVDLLLRCEAFPEPTYLWWDLRPQPKFGHGAAATVRATHGEVVLLGCYHPSQQNTFTGKLTTTMLDDVFGRAKKLAGIRGERSAASRR